MSWVNAGKYYVIDSGYPSEYEFLGPYRGETYHNSEFHRRGQPRSREELFNQVHSSVRCAIERIVGVWKKKKNFAKHVSVSVYDTCRLLLRKWLFIII
jgi:hypothetical protein